MTLYLIGISLIFILGLPSVVYFELRRRNRTKIAAKKIAIRMGFTFVDAAQRHAQLLKERCGEDLSDREAKKPAAQVLQGPLAGIIYMASPWKMHGEYSGVKCSVEFSNTHNGSKDGGMLTFSAEHAEADLDDFFLYHKSLAPQPAGVDTLHAIPLADDTAKKLSFFSSDDSSANAWLLEAGRLATFARLVATQPRLVLSEKALTWMESGTDFEYTEAHLREKLDSLASCFHELNLAVINT